MTIESRTLEKLRQENKRILSEHLKLMQAHQRLLQFCINEFGKLPDPRKPV